MTKKNIWVLWMICFMTLTGCSRSFEVIRDIRELPQDHLYYIQKDNADRDIVSAEDAARLQMRYNEAFFLPWHQEQTLFEREQAEGYFYQYLDKIVDSAKKKRLKKSLTRKFTAYARWEGYPNAAMRAITIRHTDMRGLPTVRNYSSREKQSTAFDRLQVSSLPANTPVLICHITKDRKWVLAEAGFAFGWVMRRDLAAVDEAFVNKWETGTYVAFVKDAVPIRNAGGRHLKASIGSLLPKAGESGDEIAILTAVAAKSGKAMIRESTVFKETAVSSPFPLNYRNMAVLANELVDTPYGWGGKDKKRDCSSMIRDLFTPFGIWLPRHSADQALLGGHHIDFAGLTREEKQSAIMTSGIPYLTLLWLRGHIMLYIGVHQGEPLVFHNFWSTRMTDIQGCSVKKIIGRAAITTLHPGREWQSPVSAPRDLLDAIQGMTFLLPPVVANADAKPKGL